MLMICALSHGIVFYVKMLCDPCLGTHFLVFDADIGVLRSLVFFYLHRVKKNTKSLANCTFFFNEVKNPTTLH